MRVEPRGKTGGLTPSVVSEWQKVFRDTLITILAAFITVFEVAFRTTPNAYALGAALAMFGIPPALRLDEARRSKRLGNGGRPERSAEDDDPFEGPGGHYKAP